MKTISLSAVILLLSAYSLNAAANDTQNITLAMNTTKEISWVSATEQQAAADTESSTHEISSSLSVSLEQRLEEKLSREFIDKQN